MAHEWPIIPDAFARRIANSHGKRGDEWLRALPSLIGNLCKRWGFTIGIPFDLSYNYVSTAWLPDGTEVVFKIGVPWDELEREIKALRLYDGDGICRLLQVDEERFAMLLERLRPGEMLASLASTDDESATRIGAQVMGKLWRPVPVGHDFLPVAEWFDRAFRRHRHEYGGAGPFPHWLFERAAVMTRELLDSAPTDVLLHGDLHHYNILSSHRSPWLAIDPKGVTGDPGYDVGQFLHNPDLKGAQLLPTTLRRRLDVFAEELNYDLVRLQNWAFVQAVLSACWSAEDGADGWQDAILTAERVLNL